MLHGARLQRFLIAALAAAALNTGCKVERTPEEYFDHHDRLLAAREGSSEELHDRIRALGQAIGRGSAAETMLALAPASDLRIVTPDAEIVLEGPDAVRAALDRFVATPVAMEMRDVVVTVGPLGNVAWFEALVDAPGSGPAGTVLRVTGVYRRIEGAWELVQAHVSTPRTEPSPALPDSAGALPEA